jgi:hypothetical protein
MDAVEKIQEARMQEIAARPNTTVMRYTYETPEKTATSGQAMAYALEVFKTRQRLATINDDEARGIIRQDPVLEIFSRTHPFVFSLASDRASGARHFSVLQELGALRKQVEGGKSEGEATVQAQSVIFDHCKK